MTLKGEYMIKCMLSVPNSEAVIGNAELIQSWRETEDATIWVDICSEDKEKEAELLANLGCHNLAILDVQRERHPPKIELFDEQIFILYRGIYEYQDELQFDHLQIGLFVGERMIITYRDRASMSIDSLFNERGQKFLSRSPMTLALRIFHASCGFYLKNLFEFETKLESIEDAFQQNGNDTMMHKITKYRSQLVKLKRIFNYHVSIGAELKIMVDDETPIISSRELHTVNDVHERLDRLLTLSQMHYDICGDLINGYLTVVSHQLNGTMRVLTVITAIFVPLTFLAGIYGMNFENMPELKYEYSYFILMSVMLVGGVGLFGYFKKKQWL